MTAPPDSASDFGAEGARNAARYKGEAIVVKSGGELVQDDAVLRHTVRQLLVMVDAGMHCAFVHGGGRQIDERMRAANLEIVKVEGVRHTTPAAMQIIADCVAELNAHIVNVIAEEAAHMGVAARPFGPGADNGGLLVAEPLFPDTLTGRIVRVDAESLSALMAEGGIPVFHPVCAGVDAPQMNVNADDVAVAIADAVNARRLILCSDTYVRDKQGERIATIEAGQAEDMVRDGTLGGGMINKVRAAATIARRGNIGGVAILNGKGEKAILRELLSDEGAGTLVIVGAAARQASGP